MAGPGGAGESIAVRGLSVDVDVELGPAVVTAGVGKGDGLEECDVKAEDAEATAWEREESKEDNFESKLEISGSGGGW